MSDCNNPPLICPSDIEFLQCMIGCAIGGMTAAGKPVYFYKFDPDSTIKDKVYGDAEPSFLAPVELPAVIDTDITEEELTAFGARNQGKEDNDIEDPDIRLNVATSALDQLGIVIDTENRDEFEAEVNRKRRRYAVIGIHYPQGLGGMELIAEVYLVEKGH